MSGTPRKCLKTATLTCVCLNERGNVTASAGCIENLESRTVFVENEWFIKKAFWNNVDQERKSKGEIYEFWDERSKKVISGDCASRLGGNAFFHFEARIMHKSGNKRLLIVFIVKRMKSRANDKGTRGDDCALECDSWVTSFLFGHQNEKFHFAGWLGPLAQVGQRSLSQKATKKKKNVGTGAVPGPIDSR